MGYVGYQDHIKVVRCRDCKHYEYGYDPIAEECIVSDCRCTGFEVTGDHYCAWGVRADGGPGTMGRSEYGKALAELVEAAGDTVEELSAVVSVHYLSNEAEDSLTTCRERLAAALFGYRDAAYRMKEDTI